MPITLCQCNGLCEKQLVQIFNDLEVQSLLPANKFKAAVRVLQEGRIEPIGKSLGKPSGCCGGCLPHIEKIVETRRQQAADKIPEPVGICPAPSCLS